MMSSAMQRTMPTSTSSARIPEAIFRQRRQPAGLRAVQCSGYRQGSRYGRGPWGFNPMMGNVTPQQIESMIQELAKQFGPQAQSDCGNRPSYGGALLVDLEEQAEQYLLIADVPGLQKSDLKISINQADKTLKIAGERQRTATGEADSESGQSAFKKQYERSMGKFSRTLSGLPKDADLSSVSARVEKGVLTIYIQKKDLMKDEISINID